MSYYVNIINAKIDGKTECYTEADGLICYETTKTIWDNLEQYIWNGKKLVKNPNYEAEKLAELKAEKHAENDYKASEARYNQEFTITVQEQVCVFDTKQTTQADLLTAFAVCLSGATYDGWVTNNGVELDLTLEDVALISQVFKQKSNVYGKWNEYNTAINEAETIEEVERIEIDYDN